MEPTTVNRPQESHLDDQMRLLEARLVREHHELPPQTVHDRVEHARARFADARVRTFVPILVERAVRRTHPSQDLYA
jgi:hypothetical protein